MTSYLGDVPEETVPPPEGATAAAVATAAWTRGVDVKNTYESAMASKLDRGDDPNRNTLYMPSEYEDSGDDADGDDDASERARRKYDSGRNENRYNDRDDYDDRRDDDQQQQEEDDRYPSSPRFSLQRCLAWSHDDDEYRDANNGRILKNNIRSQRDHRRNSHTTTTTQSLLQPMFHEFNEYSGQNHQQQQNGRIHQQYSSSSSSSSFGSIYSGIINSSQKSPRGDIQYLSAGDAVPENGWVQLAPSRLPARRMQQSYSDDDDQMMWVITTPSTETIGSSSRGLQLVKSYSSFHSAIIDSVNSSDFHGDRTTTANSPSSTSRIAPIHWEEQVTNEKKLDAFFG
mmetsp:Transcript_122/g.211  ORF Transcript_122/g.211 Transcript_122/m.211 type:complete len:343 (+) Transcript_122:417-1445(+)|eukprot:CAMPEP_0113491838 /NCGR_PEP_ID=MMETSP0014_2-20120614/27762_1 /TAXON_ID=2857 /ORGANISM="Nitzschia sp." /LENGTH=342 /DNA_ID=CAMNT_0000385641 /DNA_START=297 /DNA_END=1325 /DNA_ORIENTATION=- /assembly_acc=CAM_ASM_000159